MNLDTCHITYFEILEKHLGDLFKEEPGDSFDFAEKYATYNTGKFMNSILPEFKEDINDFWKQNGEKHIENISSLPGLKSGYSGDIFPYQCSKLLSQTGLYIDTLLLPDPIIRVANFPEGFMSDRNLVFYLIKHSLNVFQMKDYFSSDLDLPLVGIYPNKLFLKEDIINQMDEVSIDSTIDYFNDLCDKRFKSLDEVSTITGLSDPEFASMIINSSILPPSYSDNTSVLNGLLKGKQEMAQSGVYFVKEAPIGICLSNYIFGRMRGIAGHEIECIDFNAKPLYNVPNSWELYKWKISNDTKKYGPKLGLDVSTSVVNALQLDDFSWLGNIPIDSLIKLKNEGGLSEMRLLLRSGVEEIYECNRQELIEVANQVNANIKMGLKKHDSEIKKIEEEYQKKMDYQEKMLILGTIGIVASFLFPPSAVLALIGGGGLYNVYKTSEEYLEQLEKMNEKPMGIVFDAYHS